MGLAFLSMLFITIVEQNRFNKLKTLLLFILMILSNSRGPILSMVVTMFIIITLNINHKYIYKKVYKKLLNTVIIIFSILFISLFINSNNIFKILITFTDNNSLSRLGMYSFSINLIKKNILGYGIGSFKYLYNGIHYYPHNFILEVLLELGLQGLVVFIVPTCGFLAKYFKILKVKDENKDTPYIDYSFSVLLFAILNAQFSGNLITNEYIWFGLILIGLSLDLFYNEDSLQFSEISVTGQKKL